MNRRRFLKTLGLGAAWLAGRRCLAAEMDRPNVILCMTDDQGWGDTAYNGHPILKTPALDAMAAGGLRFDRFYSGAPVCSPTRGSCLTGRHPYRYGIVFANAGHMKRPEVTLAEVLKDCGYVTGHFGKWHLGTLTKTVKESNRGGPRGVKHYSPPWENGFDVCFATEAKVPTWNPMLKPGTDRPYGTHYWSGPERRVIEELDGDDSRVIMDRAVPFIRDAAKARRPFLAVIWFHTPHKPVVAGPRHRKLYADQPEAGQHYFGCLTAMDEQMGRLRKELRELGVAENTMLWFCSDNGPEERKETPTNGRTGGLRGRKRSLFEGGIRVPGLLEWPAVVTKPRRVTVPCGTEDYFPTVLSAVGNRDKATVRPVDGVDLMPLIRGEMTSRPRPMGRQSKGQLALIDNRWKLIRPGRKSPWMLFDLIEDPNETKDLAAENPELVTNMTGAVLAWQQSCDDSAKGKDYR